MLKFVPFYLIIYYVLCIRYTKTDFYIFTVGVIMDLLKQKILNEGEVYEGNILKVDGFLNHQIDCVFMGEVGKEFHRLFKDEGVNKILTIEASGIAIGVPVAQEFGCPLLFAKKTKTKNIAGDVYSTKVESFTHGKVYDVIVSKKFLGKGDRVLIVDDFLANGKALEGLMDIVNQAGAKIAGCAIAIEKGFQGAGDKLRKQGVRVESLALIDEMTDSSVKFRR